MNLAQITKLKLEAAEALEYFATLNQNDHIDWSTFCDVTGCSKAYFYKLIHLLIDTEYVRCDNKQYTISARFLGVYLKGDEEQLLNLYGDWDERSGTRKTTWQHHQDFFKAQAEVKAALRKLIRCAEHANHLSPKTVRRQHITDEVVLKLSALLDAGERSKR